MKRASLTVIASRPGIAAAIAPLELRRPDFCWTEDGEILAPPALPCADVDTCGCAWSFSGISSARACSWGVVEERALDEVVTQVQEGRYLAGWAPGVDNFAEFIMDDLHDLSERAGGMPRGSVVGIWTIDERQFGLFDRTPTQRVGAPR